VDEGGVQKEFFQLLVGVRLMGGLGGGGLEGWGVGWIMVVVCWGWFYAGEGVWLAVAANAGCVKTQRLGLGLGWLESSG